MRFFNPLSFWSVVPLANRTVTVATNSDKTGYTASTVTDKTGYSLTAGAAGWSAIKSIQYGTITMPGGTATATATLSPSVTINKAVLIHLGTSLPDTYDIRYALVRLSLTAVDTVTATAGFAPDVQTATVSFCVVEFY